MRPRLELTPNQRAVWSVVAITLLLWGVGGGHARLFAAVLGFFLILYAAGGGRVPWKIKLRDYLLYVAIAASLVIAIVIYAFVQARRGR